MKRAIFLDRDGTLIEEKNYLHRPEDVVVYPEAPAALKRLMDASYCLIIVTNQSGVGRGYYPLSDVDRVHERLIQYFAGFQVKFDRIYVAPEAPGQPSRGRKPSPQFLFDARDEFGLDLARCYMVGDKLIDLECGWNAGVNASILVRTGYGREHEPKLPTTSSPAIVRDTLRDVADWILQDKTP